LAGEQVVTVTSVASKVLLVAVVVGPLTDLTVGWAVVSVASNILRKIWANLSTVGGVRQNGAVLTTNTTTTGD